MLYIKTKIPVITGPTASGKTDISIMLAKKINGEIVSADSMQIYKYMDIGTAKPDLQERKGIHHYMMDEVSPNEEFSVAKYKENAELYIKKIIGEEKKPIIVGGTGLYINSLIYNIKFEETVCDWAFRDKMGKVATDKGLDYLHSLLMNVDPESAEKIHANNVKRVIRALEVYEHTGQTISSMQKKSREIPPAYDYKVFILNMDRDTLYNRINTRVDIMFEKGLIDEVEKLLNLGYKKNSIALQGIGYKEVIEYLNNKTSYEEMKEAIKIGTRRYAKRQLTWFKKIENAVWLEVDEGKLVGNIEIIEETLA